MALHTSIGTPAETWYSAVTDNKKRLDHRPDVGHSLKILQLNLKGLRDELREILTFMDRNFIPIGELQ